MEGIGACSYEVPKLLYDHMRLQVILVLQNGQGRDDLGKAWIVPFPFWQCLGEVFIHGKYLKEVVSTKWNVCTDAPIGVLFVHFGAPIGVFGVLEGGRTHLVPCLFISVKEPPDHSFIGDIDVPEAHPPLFKVASHTESVRPITSFLTYKEPLE